MNSRKSSGSAARCVGAVSYTHLDVYKRQVSDPLARILCALPTNPYLNNVLLETNPYIISVETTTVV